MEVDYFELLNYLELNKALNKPISLSDYIRNKIPVELNSHDEGMAALLPLRKVLNKLLEERNINYEPALAYPMNKNSYQWGFVINIMVGLTEKGHKTIVEHNNIGTSEKLNEIQTEAHKSNIDVNESIKEANKSAIATGKSVIDTNNSMITIAINQNKVNKTIADNSVEQTKILNNQRLILWMSVLVAACSAFISYLSYRKDVPSNQLKQELKVINKRIDTLMQRLPQINHSPGIKQEKPASSKKN